MSNDISFPSTPKPGSSLTPTINLLTAREGVSARLLEIPAPLRSVDSSLRVQGEIIDTKPDGTVRIQTSSGEITARLPDRVTANTGQHVDVNLSTGRPPTQATITAQPTSIKSDSTPQREPTSPPSDPSATVPRNPSQPDPIDRDLRQIAQTRAASSAQSGQDTLKPNQTVQMQSVSIPEARQALATTVSKEFVLNVALSSHLSTTLDLTPSFYVDGNLKVLLTQLLADTQVQPKIITLNSSSSFFTPSSIAPSDAPTNLGHTSSQLMLIVPLSPSPINTRNNLGLPSFSFPLALPQTTENSALHPLIIPSQIDLGSNGAARVQSQISDISTLGQVLIHPILAAGSPPALPSPIMGSMPLMIETPSAIVSPFTILGATAQGHLILQGTPNQSGLPAPLFVLQSPAGDMPTGTRLFLTALAPTTGSPSGTATWPGSFQSIGRALTTDLSDLLSFLLAQNGTMSAQDPNSIARILLPQPQNQSVQQLPAAALFFLAAARSGDLQGWLGDKTLDILRRSGKTALLDQMEGTFSTLRRIMGEATTTGEWRGMLLPFQFHQDILPVRLFMKNNAHPHSQHRDGSARFVLDVNFDRMGLIQLDLLYREKNLDTILRTELPLSMAMRGVLEQKYAKAMGHTGCTGALYFQDGLKNWVTIDASTEVIQVLA